MVLRRNLDGGREARKSEKRVVHCHALFKRNKVESAQWLSDPSLPFSNTLSLQLHERKWTDSQGNWTRSQKWESKDRDLAEPCLGKQSPGKSLWNGFASRLWMRYWQRREMPGCWKKRISTWVSRAIRKALTQSLKFWAWGYLNNSKLWGWKAVEIVGFRVLVSSLYEAWTGWDEEGDSFWWWCLTSSFLPSSSHSISFYTHTLPLFSLSLSLSLKCNLWWLFSSSLFFEWNRTHHEKNPSCKCWVLISHDLPFINEEGKEGE